MKFNKNQYGDKNIETADTIAKLGCIYGDMWDFDKAKEFLKLTLEI